MNNNQPAVGSIPGVNLKGIVVLAVGVTLAVAYQLYVTAQQTGNWEGFWFSMAHTAIVAVGTVLALRK